MFNEEINELLALVVSGLDTDKHFINTEVDVSLIKKRAHDITEMQKDLQTKNNTKLELTRQRIKLNVSGLCSEYRRFKAYVDLYKQLGYNPK